MCNISGILIYTHIQGYSLNQLSFLGLFLLYYIFWVRIEDYKAILANITVKSFLYVRLLNVIIHSHPKNDIMEYRPREQDSIVLDPRPRTPCRMYTQRHWTHHGVKFTFSTFEIYGAKGHGDHAYAWQLSFERTFVSWFPGSNGDRKLWMVPLVVRFLKLSSNNWDRCNGKTFFNLIGFPFSELINHRCLTSINR